MSLILAVACTVTSGNNVVNSPSSAATLPELAVNTTRAPDAEISARTYLDAWQREDYAAMYSMLTALSRDSRLCPFRCQDR
ncbi:MAG: hypothetical protein AB1345_06485 [Chloroflexota bacterium]